MEVVRRLVFMGGLKPRSFIQAKRIVVYRLWTVKITTGSVRLDGLKPQRKPARQYWNSDSLSGFGNDNFFVGATCPPRIK